MKITINNYDTTSRLFIYILLTRSNTNIYFNIFLFFQRKSGSFLARRSISVTRVVAMIGGDGENTTIVNTSSNRNFVFCSVSPASVKAAAENAEAQNKQNQSSAPLIVRVSSTILSNTVLNTVCAYYFNLLFMNNFCVI